MKTQGDETKSHSTKDWAEWSDLGDGGPIQIVNPFDSGVVTHQVVDS